MHSNQPEYLSSYDASRHDNSGRVICPGCGEVHPERDMETYFEQDTDRSLQICTRCREDHEQEHKVSFDTDTLPPPQFSPHQFGIGLLDIIKGVYVHIILNLSTLRHGNYRVHFRECGALIGKYFTILG